MKNRKVQKPNPKIYRDDPDKCILKIDGKTLAAAKASTAAREQKQRRKMYLFKKKDE